MVLKNKLNYFEQLTFSIAPSSSDKLKAFLAVLQYFGWKKGVIIYEEIEEFNKDECDKYSESFNYLTVESGSNIDDLVNRIINPLGTTMYYVFMNSTESYKLQLELIDSKLLIEGNGIIFDQNSGYECIIDGALIITVKGQEFSSSNEDYINSAIENVFFYLFEHIKTESNDEIIFYLNILLNKNFTYSLVNIQDGERIVVGKIINEKLSLFNNIIFPGDSQEIPKSIKKSLQLSIEAGSSNPIGAPFTIGKIGGYGSFVALEVINEGDGLLQNFQLEMFNFDCGASIYDLTFANACYLKDKENFGLAHVGAAGSGMAIGSMKSFKALNLTFPIVSASNGDVSLNSTATYPMYMRVVVSNAYAYTLIPIFIRAMGWEKCAILYQNDTWGASGYYYFNQSIQNHDLSIINPESSRALPPNLDRDGINEYSYILQEIIDSQARFLVLILLQPAPYYVFEEFYDLGLRKGDLIILTTNNELISFTGYDNAYEYKVYEIAIPFLAMYGQSWVEPLGSKIKSLISKVYGSQINAYSCYYFDAIYIIAYALDYMVNRGLDYTDPDKLQKIMRSQQFNGCTGKVIIEKGSNDRIMDALDIEVNRQDEYGNITTFIMGLFKPYSTQLIKIQQPLLYADGTSIKPSDLRNTNYKCPFPDNLIKTFPKGRVLVFGICFGVALISLIITIYIWKKYWKFSIALLKEEKEISVQDFIVGATIVIEFFQFSSMGPDFSPISPKLAELSYAFTLSLDSFFKLENGIFWVIVNIVFGAIIIWVILCLVVLLSLDEKFQTIFIFRYLDTFADYLMPILGDLCFIPFISICLDIFLCDQSIGDNFTDSFLSQDCYYFCWKGEHLIYAILSVFALIAYLPLAVFCRPLWQELQPLLHVKAAPHFLMVKTVVQIALIVMNKTVKRAESTIHGVLFILVMVLYIIFLLKVKPYNYPRFSWWQTLVLIGVVWLSVLSIINQNLRENTLILTFILILGLVIIAVVGVFVQRKKYPSLLFRKKGPDTSTLFKFAFTFGKHSKLALSKIVPSAPSTPIPLKNENYHY